MRLKEFIITIIIFTIIYFLFFVIYDAIRYKSLDNKEKKKAIKTIDFATYLKFALFYGIIESQITEDLLKKIYFDSQSQVEKYITIASKKYNISNYEYIIVILYLEYLELIVKKEIDMNKSMIVDYTFQDMQYLNKYTNYFSKKMSFEEISKEVGSGATNELYYIDKTFLFPGIRIINSIICYFDDKEVSL